MSADILTAEGLRGQSSEELLQRLDDLKQELFNLRFQHHTGQLENFMRMKLVKRGIARVKTVLHERELEADFVE
jgi:large subunit ribosomal protein L29